MIYDIRHITTYHYGARVGFARCLMRLLPRDAAGQRVLWSRLTIDPEPVETVEETDFFGNRQDTARFATPHETLVIRAEARVEVLERPLPSGGCPAWDSVAEQALAVRDIGGDSPVHGLFPSRALALLPQAADFARDSFPPGMPVLDAARDLTRRIHAEFAYDPGATTVSTPLEHVFAQKAGVCQDFAHLMISGLRGLGVPARYVSGYLRTLPPPGAERLVGADATHAWVSVWCGEDLGWVEFDPTNDRLAGGDHVVLAIGRDYADVAPVSGVVMASAQQRLEVEVDVAPA